MTAIVVSSPYTTILGLDGIGLTLGEVYVGAPNQDPQVNPQAVFWDAGLTIPATQPLDVSAGYIMRLGTPAVAYTSGDYSMRVLDHLGVQIFYSLTSGVVTPVVPPARTLLTDNAAFYVTAIGNDATGTGTAGSPWATIQKAFNVLQGTYDLGGFTVTIHVGAGTFNTGAMTAPIPGAVAGASAVLVAGAGVGVTIVRGAVTAFAAGGGGAFTVANMTLGGIGTFCLSANSGGNIAYGNVAFAATTQAHINVGFLGTVLCAGNYSITGGSGAHFFTFGAGGNFGHFGGPYVCTLTGTPAFSVAFAQAGDNSFISAQNVWLTFSGAATGSHYFVYQNATIDTFSSGASYFPGSTSGTTLSNGVYA